MTLSAQQAFGFACRGHITSPIQGASKGNTEFLACFDKVSDSPTSVAGTESGAGDASAEAEGEAGL